MDRVELCFTDAIGRQAEPVRAACSKGWLHRACGGALRGEMSARHATWTADHGAEAHQQ
jgi:hypothetical protein